MATSANDMKRCERSMKCDDSYKWKLYLRPMVPMELKDVIEVWNAMIDISESYTCGQLSQWNEMMRERLWNKPWLNYSELTSKIELPKSLWTQVMPICDCFNKCYALWVFSIYFAFLHIREWKLCIALFGEKYLKNKWCVTYWWF